MWIPSKLCNVTCTHATSMKLVGSWKRKFANSSGRILGPITQLKERNTPVRSVQKDNDHVVQSKGENGEHQIDSKSVCYNNLTRGH